MNKKRNNILVVDDSLINIKMLSAVLIADYDISVTTSGAEAIEIASSPDSVPDLILLDITMPEMDGYEVCKRLKADEKTRHIPVIFITARNEEKEETKGFELGAVDYITKPFSPAIVKARLSTHLDLKHHRDNLEELNHLLKREITERKRSEEALRHLLKKQEVNIELAKKVLNLVNGIIPRYTSFSRWLLFADVISAPCYAEGGDHYFVRNLAATEELPAKTVISLKDQSGHEVNCVLRSIITDLMHNAILNTEHSASLECIVSRLNDEICCSELFNMEDFFTSINAEIDHHTLAIRYVSTGHPPFLLIRKNEVRCMPVSGTSGENIPVAIKDGIRYMAGEYQLREGDKLIFYTDGLTEMPLKHKKSIIAQDELKQLVSEIITTDKSGNQITLSASDIAHKLLQCISEISHEDVLLSDHQNGPKNTSGDDITLLFLEIENQHQYCEEIWNPESYEHISLLINELYKRLEAECHLHGYDASVIHLHLVLEEAVINAWKHGNQQNPDKCVTIRWRYGNDFHLEVIDEGEGFDSEQVPDPTIDENLIKPFGRGVFIIRHFANCVKWKEEGRHLLMCFKKYPNPSEENRIRKMKKLMKLWVMGKLARNSQKRTEKDES